MSTSLDPRPSGDDGFAEAKRLAARLHRPVYVVDGQIVSEKPRRAATTVWPSGTVTIGNPDAAGREIERNLVRKRPAA